MTALLIALMTLTIMAKDLFGDSGVPLGTLGYLLTPFLVAAIRWAVVSPALSVRIPVAAVVIGLLAIPFDSA